MRDELGIEDAGGTATLSFGRALVPVAKPTGAEAFRAYLAKTDWVPDLGARIGTAEWWRGALTCTALVAGACLLSPGRGHPVMGDVAAPLSGTEWDEARAQSITPLAYGANSGRRMAANDLVAPLLETPERPAIELSAAYGSGDSFSGVLQRAGVSESDSDAAVALISNAVSLEEIKPGTQIDITLGRRENKKVARPLDALSFRARFDLNLSLARAGKALALARQVIAIDHTPLRIQGLVGSSLYRSARAAGAPAKAVEDYIRGIASRTAIGGLGSDDKFDMTIGQDRAATGEVRLGALEYAGLFRSSGKTLRLMRWERDGREQWFDASGQTEQSGAMGMPVAGHVTSNFGLRVHPILGYTKMHKGMDIGAPWGSPIHAAMDGVVQFAGRTGGYGNFVKLASGGNIATGYGHMSRIAVRNGERVARGQVIGYVGSTGLSTGPHLHWEVWKNGISVNPRSVSMASVIQLGGEELREFKARLAELTSVKPGGR
ncbi:M23 family metallopeptidase [Sphingomonas immobilis]|uniref:M23 family metallopeptidase n=1 Tax=Sphingomonas immobilis TaxID=3063997 RepID=UPI003133C243